MTSSSNDREALARIIRGYFMWPDNSSGGDLAGVILEEFVAPHDDRIRAEQAEADAQIAASIASTAPAWDSERARTAERVARAIREANRHA
jgi:hypothetical protein